MSASANGRYVSSSGWSSSYSRCRDPAAALIRRPLAEWMRFGGCNALRRRVGSVAPLVEIFRSGRSGVIEADIAFRIGVDPVISGACAFCAVGAERPTGRQAAVQARLRAKRASRACRDATVGVRQLAHQLRGLVDQAGAASSFGGAASISGLRATRVTFAGATGGGRAAADTAVFSGAISAGVGCGAPTAMRWCGCGGRTAGAGLGGCGSEAKRRNWL